MKSIRELNKKLIKKEMESVVNHLHDMLETATNPNEEQKLIDIINQLGNIFYEFNNSDKEHPVKEILRPIKSTINKLEELTLHEDGSIIVDTSEDAYILHIKDADKTACMMMIHEIAETMRASAETMAICHERAEEQMWQRTINELSGCLYNYVNFMKKSK